MSQMDVVNVDIAGANIYPCKLRPQRPIADDLKNQ
jgi:hypothetical protein